jgi:hypothetical protein
VDYGTPVDIIEGLRARLLRIAIDRGGLLGLLALLTYAWLAPGHIVDGDNAEFSTLGKLGGAAHPTGYPLYVLWLRAFSWLPGASPAHTAALATAVVAAATVLVLHAACRAWGARPLGATFAVAVFAGAPVFVRIATTAEVFALNCLVVAAVLWLAATGGPLRGAWRALALGIVAGLGISNHMTCTLLAPVGILGVVRGAREAGRWPAVIGLAIGGLLVGLLPYAYLLVAPDTPMSWGTVRGFDDLLRMVTRAEYGGPVAFLPVPAPVPASKQLLAFAATLGRSWLWLPLVVPLVIAWRRRGSRRAGGETTWMWATLAVSWLLAGPLLVTRFNIDPVGLGLYVSQRFYLLPGMLLAIPIAIGIDALEPLVARGRLGARGAATVLATAGCACAIAVTLPHIARVHTPAVEQYARNLLRVLPERAVVFIGQDDEYFGAGYVQWALGERRDVIVVAPQLTGLAWYADRVARKGIIAPPGDGVPIVRLIDKLLAEGVPVFVEKSRAEVIATFTTYPYGTVMKVLPRGTPTPPIDQVVAENREIYGKFELGYALPGTDDEFATAIHLRYAATWKTLGRKLEALGRRDDAAWAFEAARAVGPQP